MASSFTPPDMKTSISEMIIPDVKTTLNLFGMHWRKVSGKWDYPVHTHPQYEINYVLDGEQLLTVGGDRFYQRVGDLILLRPGDSHSSKSAGGRPFTYFCIHFDIDDKSFLSLLGRLDHIFFPSGTAVAQKVSPVIGKLMDLSSQMASEPEISLSQRMRLQSAIFELFGQLLEAISAEVDLYADISYEKVELARRIRSRLQGLVFQQFKQAASDEEHYGIEDIAAELGISSSHCSRVFRQIYGISPRVFLSEQMLHEAKVLLDDPRMSVNEISTLLGYKDIAHFSRQFKRWCGISPSGYRKLREEDSTS